MPNLNVRRIYVKTATVENPGAPKIFKVPGNPTDEFQITNSHSKIEGEENHYDVVLELKITTKIAGQVLSNIKVQQAGIFQITNATPEQVKQILQTECLNTLYPYAMQRASDLAVWSTYRPIMIQHINFNAIYQQQLAQQKQQAPQQKEEKNDEEQSPQPRGLSM